MISDKCLSVDLSKIEAVKSWPVPTTVLEARSFHVLASFYRRFVSHFSTIMAPITSCMREGKFEWMQEATKAFELRRSIAFYSEKLAGARGRYNNYDVEFYAIMQAIKHWRHYLVHREYVLFTDHDALRHLDSQAKVSARHTAWISFLHQFTFSIRHQSGKTNKIADALSRCHGLLTTMHTKVTVFSTFADLYPSDAFFGRIFMDTLNGVQGFAFVCA